VDEKWRSFMNTYLAEQELWYPVSSELMASYNDGSHSKKYINGSLEWVKNGEWHRDDDKPAVIGAGGLQAWIKNGLAHRDGDKPAWIWDDGTLTWYKNGVHHRDGDKPAWIGADGTLLWYKNGLKHRTTGPAVIHPNNEHEYWINGVEITSEVKSWLETHQYTYPFTPEQQVEFTSTFG
jgi:hypothetical protein